MIRGAVQGVGFRPFVFRLAQELDLTGWVMNSAQGVFLEVEGAPDRLQMFQVRLHSEHPPRASIQSCETTILDPSGFSSFEIRASGQTGPKTALVLPDIALCDDCKRELWDSSNRRYRYPFINCTNCGPRFSIIERLPYDRPNTTMRGFTMCPACRHEYDTPSDRRFHAQPNACPVCGPGIQLWDEQGKTIAENDAAALATVEAIRNGAIVAVKGIGGFHLFAHAGNLKTVRLLRQRKQREEKPLALMVPSLDIARQLCRISPLEERLLSSPESPIVLLRRQDDADSSLVCDEVAPHNPMLGILLPYAPLHHILLHDAGIPLIATSGNLSDEPICIDETEALVRLKGIADRFLVHNRPINRHVDDSIVRIVLDRELVLRRARGYAPLPVSLPSEVPDLLAVGAHLKNTVALSRGNQVFISQHLGDLETPEAFGAFQKETAQLQELFEGNPAAVVSDLHPDYLSTSFARQRPERVVAIQHHIAHVASCMAENALTGPVLGVAWDG
ncbi:MAG: (NiFe) hydrogenase maturation protein HypF, partial [Bacteroidetes bacterium]|nr:(NiFe) hydrogenase maturation protein HypF [Bacteroidota bacterium]